MSIDSKAYFLKLLAEQGIIKSDSRILELGCGQARAIVPILEKYPDIEYLGIEPDPKSAKIAADSLKNFPRATVLNKLAYELAKEENYFDICFSLSVLEHVKQLEKFLANSVRSVKPGGRIIHRYDLGHALYPSSLKEKFQVFLGNNFGKILPENKFVCYIEENRVCEILKRNGAEIIKTTYHQMPNHKSFLKIFKADSEEKRRLAEEIIKWEYDASEYLHDFGTLQKEKLFPAVAIWSVKK